MLKELRIANLVLVETAEITFHPGLTAITGETGAGKTILLEALRLATGSRADTDSVRKGASKATIEAAFEIKKRPDISFLLEEAGLSREDEEPLLLKREISSEGRSRAFINCQMVPLSLLQSVGEKLVEFLSQHAHHDLMKEDYQRQSLDFFAGHTALVAQVREKRDHIELAKKEFAQFQEALVIGQRDRQVAANELEELVEGNLKEGEEETLSCEHRRLAHAQEIASKLNSICTLLEEPPHALIAQLKRSSPLLKSASAIDKDLEEPGQLLSQGIASLEEVRHLLQAYLGRVDNNPQRLAFIEERLAIYHKLRRKYGDPIAYKNTLSERLNSLDDLEEKIQRASLVINTKESELHSLRKKLLQQRIHAAQELSRILTHNLQAMNMPHAEVEVAVQEGEDNDDRIALFLRANLGEKQALVKDHASGGELSRLMLALQTALAKTQQTILVFDEIDANVGGQTAAVIADNLAAIGEHRQVLCVTHFPQVAKRCHHHIRIYKQTSSGRTVTHLETLNPQGREKEFARMKGE